MSQQTPVRVILVTDGDQQARRAVEVAAQQLGLRCLSASAGAPSHRTGTELLALLQQAEHDPVLVLVDDGGAPGTGVGEEAARLLLTSPAVKVLGAIAVASDTFAPGVRVDFSIDRHGRVVPGPVDKLGDQTPGELLHGDTAGVLRDGALPVVVGLGDVGKMNGADCPAHAAHITTRAIVEILSRQGAGAGQGVTGQGVTGEGAAAGERGGNAPGPPPP